MTALKGALKPGSMLAELVEVIGWRATRRLCERFGGEMVYLPRADSMARIERNAGVLRDHEEGYTATEIADRRGLSAAHVHLLLGRLARRRARR